LARTDDNLPFAPVTLKDGEVLSCEQIRWWLRELSDNPHWGWARNRSNLARALGFHGEHAYENMRNKNTGAWIYPSEQIRLSIRIRLILNGHIVPDYNRRPHSYIYANPPRPVAPPPAKLAVSTSRTGPRLKVERFEPPSQRLPDFREVFNNAKLWKTE